MTTRKSWNGWIGLVVVLFQYSLLIKFSIDQ
jgi:hypothetical protein